MSDLDRFGAIRVFLAVVEAGSFAKAAQRLALSPSAVAKAIGRLERRLGVRLLERTTRHLALTDEGARYRDTCERAVADIDTVEQSLAERISEPSGIVRVDLPPLIGTQRIAPILYGLIDRHPGLSFDIALSSEPRELVENNIDLAVRIGALPDLVGVMAKRLGVQNVVLCAAASYLCAREAPRNIADLKAHEAIATIRRGRVAPWQIEGDDGTVNWEPPSKLRVDGSGLALAAVRAGRGIGLLPKWLVAEDLASGTVREVLPGRVLGHLPVHAIWPGTSAVLPKIRVTIEALSDQLFPISG